MHNFNGQKYRYYFDKILMLKIFLLMLLKRIVYFRYLDAQFYDFFY